MLQLPQPTHRKRRSQVASSTSIGLPSIPPFTCPVLALAIEYEALVGKYNSEDAKSKPRASVLKAASARMLQIQDAVSYLSPDSAQGAAFQIMLASCDPDVIENGATQEIIDAAVQRINRLLYRALERFGSAADDFPQSREYLMPKRLDPALKVKNGEAL